MSRVVCLLASLFVLLVAPRAWAAPPAWINDAVVFVDAEAHLVRGLVVGDGKDVLVPLAAIEVDRVGGSVTTVIDSTGKRATALLIATDRASGLALVRVDRPIAHVPLKPSARSLTEGNLFALASHGSLSLEEVDVWSPLDVEPTGMGCRVDSVDGSIREGSPVVDDEGGLVGMVGMRRLLTSRPPCVAVGPALARMTAAGAEAPHRRPLIFYVGIAFAADLGKDSGGMGGSVDLRARWHDLLEARVDGAVLFLIDRPCRPNADCWFGPRLVLTPSLGVRIRIAGLDGRHEDSFAITPSIGLALGVDVPRSQDSTAQTWALVAPGVALSLGFAELRVRVRLPGGQVTAPIGEVGIGGTF